MALSLSVTTIVLLYFLHISNAADIKFINYWQGSHFEALVEIPVTRNGNSWEMVLSFNHPVDSLMLWVAEVVEKRRGGQEYLIKNKYNSHLATGTNFRLGFQGKYSGSKPTSGSAEWGPRGSSVPFPTPARTTPPRTNKPSTRHPPTTPRFTQAPPSGNPSADAVPTPNTKYDYDEVLHKALRFYEAQRSGDLPSDNLVPWRGDSALDDGKDVGLDLSGGWYDAGDHVKFGLPMAGSATAILYSLIFMKEGYQYAGQYDMALRQIRWPLDYFMKCHQRTDRFYAQVGNGDADHAQWGRPEDMNTNRPSYWVGNQAAGRGGADVVGETAAALAAGSVLFKASDPVYSHYLLSNATSLYRLAKTPQLNDVYQKAIPDAGKFYASSGVEDELAHAAAWLAQASDSSQQRRAYLNEAKSFLNDGFIWSLDWSDKRGLVNFLLYRMTKENRFKNNIEAFITDWLPGGGVHQTPKGLAWRLKWGPLRYSANVANLAVLSAREGIQPKRFVEFAEKQIHYMLGDTGRSFVVGFGVNPPIRPHHRAASCRRGRPCSWEAYNNPGGNPNILYGALVGGPDGNDMYIDDRTDFRANEVACDYNAGFTGALAGLKYFAVNPVN